MQTAWRVFLKPTGLCFLDLENNTGELWSLEKLHKAKLRIVAIFSIRHENGEIQNLAIIEPAKR